MGNFLAIIQEYDKQVFVQETRLAVFFVKFKRDRNTSVVGYDFFFPLTVTKAQFLWNSQKRFVCLQVDCMPYALQCNTCSTL